MLAKEQPFNHPNILSRCVIYDDVVPVEFIKSERQLDELFQTVHIESQKKVVNMDCMNYG